MQDLAGIEGVVGLYGDGLMLHAGAAPRVKASDNLGAFTGLENFFRGLYGRAAAGGLDTFYDEVAFAFILDSEAVLYSLPF
jgi:hypothetical protein